ncbi:hypothetical protein ABIB85_008387 [Bradyrhizobium sp. JR1.5]
MSSTMPSVAEAIRPIVYAARLALNRIAGCRLKLVASATDSRAASAASSTSIIGSRIAISSIRFGVRALMVTHCHPRWLIQCVVASCAAVREAGDGSMSNIARDSDIVELTDAPLYDYGDKVRANRTIRNDGTYVGKEIGEVLVKKGELGYVVSIGTFLQQFYIYGVEFLESGCRVGMKRKELDLVTRSHRGEEPCLSGEAP